ncbi:MAG: hypothetical protein PG981_000161 [Wolbachia endosymbiont of Ctenocephalides orientis wCori]|nr:MAG: hypothetical protein PG981_000161 [Wolbachia endosymbiont of Ctenocephalides orientis wCori]
MLNSSTFNSREFRGSELYIEEILNDQAAVDGLNAIHEDKLEFICIFDKLHGWDIISILKKQEAVKGLNAICKEKLRLIFDSSSFYSGNIERILSNQKVVNRINSTHKDKLELILNSCKFYGRCITTILGSQEAVNGLNSINENKLELILKSGKFCALDIREILSNKEIIDRINATSFSVLKMIVNDSQLSGGQILSLYKYESFEVLKIEKNMRSALSLRKVGKIDSITTDYLLNDDRIYWDVIDYLGKSHKFPRREENKIEKILQTEFTINEESDEQHHSTPTRLGLLYLEQMITGQVLSPIKHPEPSL